MPRKKSGFDRLGNFNTSSLLSTPRSYISLAYGALTVIVLFAIVFLGLRAFSQRGIITDEAGKTESEQGRQSYEVKEGDNLWTIAEQFYKDGYKWTEIARENKLSNPDIIEKGMKLTIPTVVAGEEKAAEADEKITGSSFTVKEGDNLWVIAVRAYGDGYKWVEIAKENNLSNPNLIHPGNQFQLSR